MMGQCRCGKQGYGPLSTGGLVDANASIPTADLGAVSCAIHVTGGIIGHLLGSVDELDGVTAPIMCQHTAI
jgi:hypothetical protein